MTLHKVLPENGGNSTKTSNLYLLLFGLLLWVPLTYQAYDKFLIYIKSDEINSMGIRQSCKKSFGFFPSGAQWLMVDKTDAESSDKV